MTHNDTYMQRSHEIERTVHTVIDSPHKEGGDTYTSTNTRMYALDAHFAEPYAFVPGLNLSETGDSVITASDIGLDLGALGITLRWLNAGGPGVHGLFMAVIPGDQDDPDNFDSWVVMRNAWKNIKAIPA